MRAELHGGRRELRTGVCSSELRVGDASAVAVWESEVEPGARCVVQFVWRPIVAEPVAAILGEPELARLRIPVEAHAVPDATREELGLAPVRPHPHDRLVVVAARRLADVTGRAHWHVEHPVRPERDELPAMDPIPGVRVAHHNGRGRVVQARLDVLVAQYPAHFGDVERAVAERHPVRRVEPAGDDPNLQGTFGSARGG